MFQRGILYLSVTKSNDFKIHLTAELLIISKCDIYLNARYILLHVNNSHLQDPTLAEVCKQDNATSVRMHSNYLELKYTY